MRSRLCALPLAHVVETMRPLPVERCAGAPAVMRGLAVVRGVPVPVLHLGELIDGEEEAADMPGRFVTAAVDDRRVALAVDEVIGVRPIEAAALHALPPLLRDAAIVAAIGVLDAQLLVVLQGARLLPEAVAAWLAAEASPA